MPAGFQRRVVAGEISGSFSRVLNGVDRFRFFAKVTVDGAGTFDYTLEEAPIPVGDLGEDEWIEIDSGEAQDGSSPILVDYSGGALRLTLELGEDTGKIKGICH